LSVNEQAEEMKIVKAGSSHGRQKEKQTGPGEADDYEWHLNKPKRLKKLIKPDHHPQPVRFGVILSFLSN